MILSLVVTLYTASLVFPAQTAAPPDSTPTAEQPPGSAQTAPQPQGSAQSDSQAPDASKLFLDAFVLSRKHKSITYDARYEYPAGQTHDATTVAAKVTLAPSPTKPGMQNMKFAMKLLIDDGQTRRPVDLAWDGELLRIVHGADRQYYETGPGLTPRDMPEGSHWMNLLIPQFFYGEVTDVDFESRDVTVEHLGKRNVGSSSCHVFLLEGGGVQDEGTSAAPTWNERWFIGVDDHLPKRIEQADIYDPQAKPITLTYSNFKVNVPLDKSAFVLERPKTEVKTEAKSESGGTKTTASESTTQTMPADPAISQKKPGTTETGATGDSKTGGTKTVETGETTTRTAEVPKAVDQDVKRSPGTKPATPEDKVREKKKKETVEPGEQKKKKADIGDTAPEWELKDAYGKTHKLSDYRGKVVLLDFWKVGCSACTDCEPFLKQFQQKYANQGFVIVGINCFDKKDPITYIKESKFNYPQMIDGDAVAKAYRVRGQPTFITVGRDGKIARRTSGHWDGMEKSIARKLEKQLKEKRK